MGKEQLRAIFIEEAGEIIEKLDADIIDFEADPENKELMNELFRGVHTLKGNANAFGFTRLGGFVHHFEDLLDNLRNGKLAVSSSMVDTLLNGVDVIKETMNYEIDGIQGTPDSYDGCLEAIIALLDNKHASSAPKPEKAPEPLKDIAQEFITDPAQTDCAAQLSSEVQSDIKRIERVSGQKTFLIELTFDKDIYFRGYDHAIFFRMLSDLGTIVESYWNCEGVGSLEQFNAEDSLFGDVSLIFTSEHTQSEIEEIFEFLFDNEYKVIEIESNEAAPIIQETSVTKPVKQPEIHEVKKEEQTPVQNTETHPKAKKEQAESAQPQKSYIKIDTTKLDELFDSVGELVIAQNFITQNEKVKAIGDANISKTVETLSKITKLIQDRVMSLRMVAIRDTFEKMKRVARDTAKKTDKEIQLIIQGEETEIDKTMIDSLSDPIVHMIRNAIDHGLEATAQERLEAGKPAEGTITLRAFHKSGNINIAITDDGRGIDKNAVLKKAIERGLVSEDDQLSDQQIYALIMQPGFSTAKTISDISGRGVGLDVVKTSIEKLRGKVEITSEFGQGSTFSIVLPLTLAIIDGMLVETAGDIFIIPTLSVVESFVPQKDIIHMFKGQGEFVNLRGEQVPVVRLNEILSLNNERPNIWEKTLVCVETEKGKIALLVDALLGRQQVVIKTLGRSLAKIKEIAGGAILGNGEIALILNIDGISSDVKD